MRKILIALALTMFTQAALAVPITYTVSRTVGLSTVMGTITTDGVIGTLAQSDVTNWNLVLNNGRGAVTTLQAGPNSMFILEGGGELTATLASLSVQFTDANQDFQFFNLPETAQWDIGSQNGGPSMFVVSEAVNFLDLESDSVRGVNGEVFATVQAVAVGVPEPESLALLGLGLVAVVFVRRKPTRWIIAV